LRLDSARHEIWHDDRKVSLSPKEFAVLEYLMTRPGHVVSTEDLLEHVWDENIDPFTQTVRVTVGMLRRKLGGEPSMIETVVGKGYRLKEV
jgi:DNA-binding response OmpR family regulator